MKSLALCVILLAAASSALSGQRLLVFSEFQRVRPDGQVVEADRVEHRREIISPAVVANGRATFRVAIQAPANTPYHLHIGQNPDDTFTPTLYQEEYTRSGDEWIPDRVKPVSLPHSAQLGTDQKVQTYLLDLWAPESIAAGRYRLELQLNVGDEWTIYPMEIRVMQEKGPGPTEPSGALPPLEARSDTVARTVICGHFTGKPPRGAAVPLDRVAAFTARNVAQDLRMTRDYLKADLTKVTLGAAGFAKMDDLCKDPLPAPAGAEWWLRVRDKIYRGFLGE